MFKMTKLELAILVVVLIHASQAFKVPQKFKLLQDGYVDSDTWLNYSPGGSLEANIGEFTNGKDCVRVVFFTDMYHQILEYVESTCDKALTSTGLVYLDRALYYYRHLVVTEENDGVYVVTKRVQGKEACIKTTYRPATSGGKGTEVDMESDINCKELIIGDKLDMLLLGKNGNVQGYTATSEWSTFNPWEPFGAMLRTYESGVECFQVLALTSYGRPLDSVRVSCGPVQGLIMTENTLHYGNAVMVKPADDTMNKFIVFLNYRDGTCITRVFSVEVRSGRVIKEMISRHIIFRLSEDKECQDFIGGNIVGFQGNKDKKIEVHIEQTEYTFRGLYDGTKNPPGILYGHTPLSQWEYINTPLQLGVMTRSYQKDESCVKLITLNDGGNAVFSVTDDCKPIQRLAIRGNYLYIGTLVKIKRNDELPNRYIIYYNWDDESCYKYDYKLVQEEGRMKVRTNSPLKSVLGSVDEECSELLEGTNLKNPRAKDFGAITDDIGSAVVF